MKKVGLKYYKRQKTPKCNKNQLEQVGKKCRKKRRQIATLNIFIIIDNERYFTFSNDKMPQNVGFNAFDKEHASDNVKYKIKQNYSRKVFVWLTLSSKGISTPFIGTTKGSVITADIYINKYLSQLCSFVEEHDADDKLRF